MRNKNFSAQKELLCGIRTFLQDKNTLNKNIGRINYLYSKEEKIKILVLKIKISKVLNLELKLKAIFLYRNKSDFSLEIKETIFGNNLKLIFLKNNFSVAMGQRKFHIDARLPIEFRQSHFLHV